MFDTTKATCPTTPLEDVEPRISAVQEQIRRDQKTLADLLIQRLIGLLRRALPEGGALETEQFSDADCCCYVAITGIRSKDGTAYQDIGGITDPYRILGTQHDAIKETLADLNDLVSVIDLWLREAQLFPF